jgi:hypothetical protein
LIGRRKKNGSDGTSKKEARPGHRVTGQPPGHLSRHAAESLGEEKAQPQRAAGHEVHEF